MPCSRESPRPRDEHKSLVSPALAVVLHHESHREATFYLATTRIALQNCHCMINQNYYIEMLLLFMSLRGWFNLPTTSLREEAAFFWAMHYSTDCVCVLWTGLHCGHSSDIVLCLSQVDAWSRWFSKLKKSFSKDDNQTYDTWRRHTQRGSSWEADADGSLVGDPGSKCDACGSTRMPHKSGLLIRPDNSCVGVFLLWILKHAQMLGPDPPLISMLTDHMRAWFVKLSFVIWAFGF